MEAYRKVICESIDLEELIIQYTDNIYSKGGDTSWFMQGGCYEFAMALGQIVDVNYWIVNDEVGYGVHAFVEYDGKYYDINGMHNTKQDVVSEITTEGDIQFEQVDFSELDDLQEHSTNWKSIATDLKS